MAVAVDIYAGGPGSGCNPDAGKCGRPKGVSDDKKGKTYYHGTEADIAEKILKEGVKTGYLGQIWTSSAKGDALGWAYFRYSKAESIALVSIQNVEKLSWHRGKDDAAIHWHITDKHIAPEYVVRVEFYKTEDLRPLVLKGKPSEMDKRFESVKPFKVVDKSVLKAAAEKSLCYMVLPVFK